MNAQATTTTKPFWQGTNFYFAALMVVFSFFGGTENYAQQIVSTIVGVIALVGTTRQLLPSFKLQNWKEVLGKTNTWNYLSGVAVLILPQATEFIPALRDVYDAMILGNWGLVISRGIALLTIIFYLLKGK